jgi:hypothetical protein
MRGLTLPVDAKKYLLQLKLREMTKKIREYLK